MKAQKGVFMKRGVTVKSSFESLEFFSRISGSK